MSEKQSVRNRGLSNQTVAVARGTDNKGTLSHSLAQITSFMSTSFPSRGKRDDKSPRNTDVATLKEEFERKIAAVVFCLEEKAEENIDLSYKLKALQEASKQKEADKDRVIEDLQKALKAKEEECLQLEKKANDEMLNELNRRIQTITHCLNDMAEENLKLRTQVTANANKSNGKQAILEEIIPVPNPAVEDSPLNVVKNKPKRKSKIGVQEIGWDNNNSKLDNGQTTQIPKQAISTDAGTKSPFSPPPPNAAAFPTENETIPSSASFLSSLAASSSILSSRPAHHSAPPISISTSSSFPSASNSPRSSTPPTTPSSAPTAAASKIVPSTTSVSTNTSPIPTPASPPPTPSTAHLPPAVADMKSEILAEEILKDSDWLKKFSDTYLVPPPPSQSLALLLDIINKDKLKVEARVKLSLDDRIKELETQLAEHETNVTELKAKLAKETDRTGSLGDSVQEYEKKLKELEGRMWDNLNKEAQRRTEAESKAKRLKKKVDELQFLLDELKDDGSDEDDEEEEKEEKEEKPQSTESESSENSQEEGEKGESK